MWQMIACVFIDHADVWTSNGFALPQNFEQCTLQINLLNPWCIDLSAWGQNGVEKHFILSCGSLSICCFVTRSTITKGFLNCFADCQLTLVMYLSLKYVSVLLVQPVTFKECKGLTTECWVVMTNAIVIFFTFYFLLFLLLFSYCDLWFKAYTAHTLGNLMWQCDTKASLSKVWLRCSKSCKKSSLFLQDFGFWTPQSPQSNTHWYSREDHNASHSPHSPWPENRNGDKLAHTVLRKK